jgi:hypothetical protein
MFEPANDPRDQLRMARQAFVAVGGTLPESHGTDAAPSCDDYWAAAAVAMWFAAQAELTSAGPEYVAYYTGLSDGFAAAGAACDAA